MSSSVELAVSPPGKRDSGRSVLVVNEVFGPTFQGEGPTMGQRCLFVRLGRCDLACAWCDTPYTWDWKGRNGVAYDPAVELSRLPVDEVMAQCRHAQVPRVVITGGEPLLQRSSVSELVHRLDAVGIAVEIETNGRHAALSTQVDVQYNVSPKLASSGESADRRLRPGALTSLLAATSTFKFVCGSVEDLDEVAVLTEQVGIPNHRIWISPLGTTTTEILAVHQSLADPVCERGWNMTSRLHVLCWGDERV